MTAKIEEIQEMQKEALADFVQSRLAGEAVGPPISPRSDDQPEDLLVDIYITGSTKFRSEMEACVLNWLRNVESGERDAAESGFARLLVLIGSTRMVSTQHLLACLLFKNDKRWLQLPGCNSKTLMHELMLTLRQMPKFQMVGAWTEYLCEPGLEAVAFGGIADASLDQALAHLPIIAGRALAQGNPSLLRTCLVYFLARWAKERPQRDVVQAILIQMRRPEPDDARQLVIKMLRKLPTTREIILAKVGSNVPDTVRPFSTDSSDPISEMASAGSFVRCFGRGMAVGADCNELPVAA